MALDSASHRSLVKPLQCVSKSMQASTFFRIDSCCGGRHLAVTCPMRPSILPISAVSCCLVMAPAGDAKTTERKAVAREILEMVEKVFMVRGANHTANGRYRARARRSFYHWYT